MAKFDELQIRILKSIIANKTNDVLSLIREFAYQNGRFSSKMKEMFQQKHDTYLSSNKNYLLIPILEDDAIELLRQFFDLWNYMEENSLIAVVNNNVQQTFSCVQVLDVNYVSILTDPSQRGRGNVYITSNSITDLLNYKGRLNKKLIPFKRPLEMFVSNKYQTDKEKQTAFKRMIFDYLPIAISLISLLISVGMMLVAMTTQNVTISNLDKTFDTIKVKILP